MTSNCLLFLYMVPGTGHQKAAEAIMEAASHMDPRVELVTIDAGHQTFPLLGRVVNRMYLQMLKSAPFIWEYLYDNPDVEEATRDARELLRLAGSMKLKRMLKKYRPAAVVCTQAMPAIAMAAEKRSGRLDAVSHARRSVVRICCPIIIDLVQVRDRAFGPFDVDHGKVKRCRAAAYAP